MPSRERRNDDIWHPEAELGCKTIDRRSIPRIVAWVGKGSMTYQVAVCGWRRKAGCCADRSRAREVAVGVDRDTRNICSDPQCSVRIYIRMSGHRWHVVEWASAFIVAEEEDRIVPRRAAHQGIYDGGNFSLSIQNRLARAWVLVTVAEVSFDERKAGKRPVGHIRKVLADRRDVSCIDAEVICGIASRLLGWSGRSAAYARRRSSIEILAGFGEIRISSIRNVGCI